MRKLVCGFAFDQTLRHVALIKKNRPDWQAGRLNAIGGHVEEGEVPLQAQSREFLEEAGVELPVTAWRWVAQLEHVRGHVGFTPRTKKVVDFFATTLDYTQEQNVRSMTDETVMWVNVHSLHAFPCIPNLLWLVPLARHVLTHDKTYSVMKFTTENARG